MNIIARTAAVAAATLAGLAPAASATAGRAPVTAAPGTVGCPAAGWRDAATIPVGQFAFGVAVDTRTDMVYAASEGTGTHTGTVSVINGQTRTVTATVAVGGQPYGVAVNPQTDTVYVTNGADGTVWVINGQANTVTATIPVGGRPYGIWADRLTNQVFVAGDGGVTVIDGQTNTVVDRIATGADPFWLALDPLTGILYVTDGARLSVTAINVTTDQIVATIFLRFAPEGIAMDPKTDTAYVVVAANRLFAIDGRTNAITARRTVGHDAFGVAADAATNQVFVVNPNENTVTVVNGRSGRVAGSVPVGRAPFIGLAADPGRGIVYVTNDFGDSVSVLVRCRPSGG